MVNFHFVAIIDYYCILQDHASALKYVDEIKNKGLKVKYILIS